MATLRRVRDYLLTVAGPVRTPHHNVQLAALLALNAGVLNSVGFVAVSVYTSHMTGLTASVADQLVLGGVLGALGYLELGFAALVPLALVLLVAAAAPLAADVRRHRRAAQPR